MDIQQQVERYQRNDRLVVDLYYKLKVDDPYRTKGLHYLLYKGYLEIGRASCRERVCLGV